MQTKMQTVSAKSDGNRRYAEHQIDSQILCPCDLGNNPSNPDVNVNQNVDHRAHQKIDHHGKNQST
ncbi:hypothetical protein, partial [Brevibacillus sp. AY1]